MRVYIHVRMCGCVGAQRCNACVCARARGAGFGECGVFLGRTPFVLNFTSHSDDAESTRRSSAPKPEHLDRARVHGSPRTSQGVFFCFLSLSLFGKIVQSTTNRNSTSAVRNGEITHPTDACSETLTKNNRRLLLIAGLVSFASKLLTSIKRKLLALSLSLTCFPPRV